MNSISLTLKSKSKGMLQHQFQQSMLSILTISVLRGNPQVRNVQQDGLWLGQDSAVVKYPGLLEQYQVKNCTLQKGQLSRNLTLSLHLSRRYVYHLWTTFLPTCLLLSLG